MPLGLVLFIAACQQSSPENGASSAAGSSAERGAALYAQNCVPCHRENGEGVPKVFPSLSGSPAVLGDPDRTRAVGFEPEAAGEHSRGPLSDTNAIVRLDEERRRRSPPDLHSFAFWEFRAAGGCLR